MANYFLTRDLFFASPVLHAAEQAGVALQMVPAVDKLLEQLATQTCGLLILDVTMPNIPFQNVVEQAKALNPQTFVVAFGPHVHTELLQAAADAGRNLVWSRGEFHRAYKELLAHADV